MRKVLLHNDLLRDELTVLRRKLDDAKAKDDETQSIVAQYACVSANGHIESYFKGSVREKFRSRCDKQAMIIVSRQIASYSNFRHGKIVNFFNHTWQPPAQDIDLYLKENEQLSSALESIVANKNNISHNGSSNVSRLQIDGWLETVIQHLADINRICFN